MKRPGGDKETAGQPACILFLLFVVIFQDSREIRSRPGRDTETAGQPAATMTSHHQHTFRALIIIQLVIKGIQTKISQILYVRNNNKLSLQQKLSYFLQKFWLKSWGCHPLFEQLQGGVRYFYKKYVFTGFWSPRVIILQLIIQYKNNV